MCVCELGGGPGLLGPPSLSPLDQGNIMLEVGGGFNAGSGSGM